MTTYTHVAVTATVTRPWGEQSTHELGTLEAWSVVDGIPAAWKRMHKASILEDCGHCPEVGDGWRVSFAHVPFVEDEPAALEIGTTVVASNPGGREITGTLVGWASYDDHIAGELALVEWFGPCPMIIIDGDMVPNGEPRRYVGRFTTFAAVQS